MTRATRIVLLLTVGLHIPWAQGSFTRAKASSDRYPGRTWSKYVTAEEAGWSSKKLQQARAYSVQIGSAAVLVVYDGAILVDWGNVDQRYLCHSVRKSFLSALYGIHVAEGNIDVNKTLAEYHIDDNPPLNVEEKKAKVVDLLTSRSGIYHDAAAENDAMTHDRPPRSSHAPGTHWWYNNWDFNALGTIFEQQTGTNIFEEFKKRIADPLEMEDFRLEHTFYQREPDRSIHPAYKFRMSARDMARFGLLYLRHGRWKDQQIIPEQWVKESTRAHCNIGGIYNGYGYMWWVCRSGRFRNEPMYSGLGVGGNSIEILPGAELVFVHRTDTYRKKNVNPDVRLRLLGMILDARVSEPKAYPRVKPLPLTPKPRESIKLRTEILDKYVNQYRFDETMTVAIKKHNGHLLARMPEGCPFRLRALSEKEFILEDVEAPVVFELDDRGNVTRMVVGFTPKKELYGYPISPRIPLQK